MRWFLEMVILGGFDKSEEAMIHIRIILVPLLINDYQAISEANSTQILRTTC